MKRLKELREAKGLTQQQVATYINKTFQAYSYYERGNREPDIATIILLARYFSVSTDYLLGVDTPAVAPSTVELAKKIENLPQDKREIVDAVITVSEGQTGTTDIKISAS